MQRKQEQTDFSYNVPKISYEFPLISYDLCLPTRELVDPGHFQTRGSKSKAGTIRKHPEKTQGLFFCDSSAIFMEN